jgi:hypothetical protein
LVLPLFQTSINFSSMSCTSKKHGFLEHDKKCSLFTTWLKLSMREFYIWRHSMVVKLKGTFSWAVVNVNGNVTNQWYKSAIIKFQIFSIPMLCRFVVCVWVVCLFNSSFAWGRVSLVEYFTTKNFIYCISVIEEKRKY